MLLYILLIVALLFIPVVIKNRYMITLVDEILVFIIAILGLNYITGLTGESNMGMAGIFSLGAYTSVILTLRTGVSPFVGILAAIPMGIFIGNLLGRPSLRVKGIYLALSTMMFGGNSAAACKQYGRADKWLYRAAEYSTFFSFRIYAYK